MFDQLAVLSPVFLALTAASPIMKGRLTDRDSRWDVIAASVDDRTPAERQDEREENAMPMDTAGASNGSRNNHGDDDGLGTRGSWVTTASNENGVTTITESLTSAAAESSSGPAFAATTGARADTSPPSPSSVPSSSSSKRYYYSNEMAGGGATRLSKSRYDSVSGYIYHCAANPSMVDKYNDLDRALDVWSLETLLSHGVDHVLAEHIAYVRSLVHDDNRSHLGGHWSNYSELHARPPTYASYYLR